MSNPLTVLREYASMPDPTKLPPTLYLHHDDKFLTIFDCYPKAKYHFLILPRVRPGWDADQLTNLRTILAMKDEGKKRAHKLFLELKEYADARVGEIRDEMQRQWKFTWEIEVGFHPNPSMDHLHLHIISNDLTGQWLKKKKHFNSFNPKHKFFVKFEDVLSWYEGQEGQWDEYTSLTVDKYDGYLKEDMFCHLCEKPLPNMPRVKEHLQEHFDNEVKRQKEVRERKRKFDAYVAKKHAREEAEKAKAAEKAGPSGSAKDVRAEKDTENAATEEGGGAKGSESPEPKRQRTEEKSDDDKAALFEAPAA